MSSAFDKIYKIVDSFGLCPLGRAVLDDVRFPVWSGSSKPHQHHYGKGGLAIHTLEVMELCLANNLVFSKMGKQVDDRALILASLFHDAGKMWDYEPLDKDYKEWQGSVHKRRIHHISRSALVWVGAYNKSVEHKYNFVENDILHAILAHHGQRAWGSPVSPNTRLAWLLHFCDGLSARMDDCDKFDRLT